MAPKLGRMLPLVAGRNWVYFVGNICPIEIRGGRCMWKTRPVSVKDALRPRDSGGPVYMEDGPVRGKMLYPTGIW
jgi:hypothetical protein